MNAVLRSADRLRVLLIAEACNPEWVSVPLEGWSLTRAIASMTDAHLVTQVRNRDAIVRFGLAEGRDFTAIDSEAVAARARRVAEALRGGAGRGWTTVSGLAALTYPWFEHLLWKQFGPRIRAGEFDIVHRVTPISPTVPSPLAEACRRVGAKFVAGPLNGGVPWPRHFDQARRREREWLSYVRDAYRLLPGYRSTRRAAAALIIGSRDTFAQESPNWRRKSVYIPENAIEPARFNRTRVRRAERPVRCVFVGRLVPYKGADMLIEAAAPLLRRGDLVLEIIGDGPSRGELSDLIRRLRVEEAVKLSGWVDHRELQDRLVEADLFTFPSIREFGGAVVLEAMAVGLVPIVMNYGGPGELVTEKTGFALPMGSRARIISDLESLLTRLAADPSQIEVRSEPARRRAREQFTWEAKARQILEVYQWALDPSTPAPFFGMPLPDLDEVPDSVRMTPGTSSARFGRSSPAV